jgi:hypothetical protein
MAQEKNRGLVLLFLLMCIVAVVGAFQAVYIERLLSTGREAADAANQDTQSAIVAVADLRGAQAGYLATGQEPSYWMSRADALAASIVDTISKESAATPGAQARTSFEEANGALEDLRKLDHRARTLVKNDQRLIASDVIFMDSVQTANHLAQALESARENDRQAREDQLAKLGVVRLAALGGTLTVGLVGAWVLLSRARTLAALETTVPVEVPVSAPTHTLSLGSIQPPVMSPPPPPVPDVNLADAAGLCTDLARVLDTRDVPALFERAANVLDAKGLVLWVADTSGAKLQPSLAHGYSDKVLARMSGLQLDGDNATALAFRSMQSQVVGASSPSGSGAIAVPLVTATGCVGVLSAEVRSPKPGQATLSVARMIAAQFSALVSPGESLKAQAN